MQDRHDDHGKREPPEISLDELFETLWAISVITRRMAGQINAIRQRKGEPYHEQNVRTVHCHRGAPQMW